jgi:transposase
VVDGPLRKFWRAMSQLQEADYVYIQQDNAPSHAAKFTKTRMAQLGLHDFLFPWPASSPDMNPIEEIWRRMKCRVARRNPRPTKLAHLHAALQEEWDAITHEEIQALISTMSQRIAALLEANGGHTRF